MEAIKETYTFGINKSARTARKDRSIWPMIAVAIIISAIAMGPIVRTILDNRDYKNYMEDYSAELFKGERFDAVEAEYEGDRFHLTPDQARQIFIRVTLAGQGIVCEPSEEDFPESALIDMGHGATVFFAETRMTLDRGEDVPAIYVEYTYADGKKYAYKTNGTVFYYIRQPLNEARSS